MAFFALVSTAGFALFLGAHPSSVLALLTTHASHSMMSRHTASFDSHTRYGSLFLAVTGTYCIVPPLGTWIANNTAPLVRRATGLALFAMCANVGAILSTWLYGPISPGPRYTAATIILLVMQVGIALCATGARLYLARENARKKRLREESGVAGPNEAVGEMSNDSIWFTYVL